MTNRLFIFISLAALFVLMAQPSFAARIEAPSYSLEVPEGWELFSEEAIDVLSPPDASLAVTITIIEYYYPDFELLLREHSVNGAISLKDTGNTYIYEDETGARGWGMLADDGTFVEIRVTDPFAGLSDILTSVEAYAPESELAQIFKAATSKDVLEWLSYETPPFAERPKETEQAETEDEPEYYSEGEFFSANGIAVNVPKGWTASTKDSTVVLVSAKNEECFVIARVLQLESDDYEDFFYFAKSQARVMGGRNVWEIGGNVEFTTAAGLYGMIQKFPNKGLLLLASGNNQETAHVMSCISPDE